MAGVSELLVACYATLHPALSVRPSARPSVRPSIRPSHFTFLFFFGGLWPHCSCPSDQVTSNIAPAHLHATGVAVYPALFYPDLSRVLTRGSHAQAATEDVSPVKDNRIFNGPLGCLLRSFACTALSAHSLCGALLHFASLRSRRWLAPFTGLLTPSWDSEIRKYVFTL